MVSAPNRRSTRWPSSKASRLPCASERKPTLMSTCLGARDRGDRLHIQRGESRDFGRDTRTKPGGRVRSRLVTDRRGATRNGRNVPRLRENGDKETLLGRRGICWNCGQRLSASSRRVAATNPSVEEDRRA